MNGAAAKHPVEVGPSYLLVTHCKNGCPPSDLYVIVSPTGNLRSTLSIIVGCNFCGRKTHRSKIASALESWSREQNSNHLLK